MPAHSSLKASDSHNTLKSSILPRRFSALGLKLDATRHTLFITTLNIHTPGPQLQPFTTARQSIVNPTPGCSWARCQLSSSIKGVSVRLKLWKSLTLLRVVFIYTMAIPELDCRFLHNHCSDPDSDCGRSLGSTPATQRYKGRLCDINTQKFADPCECCLYRYPGDPRTRWQITPQPPLRS